MILLLIDFFSYTFHLSTEISERLSICFIVLYCHKIRVTIEKNQFVNMFSDSFFRVQYAGRELLVCCNPPRTKIALILQGLNWQ